MFNQRIYENSRPDGIGLLEVMGGIEGGEQAQQLFVPLKHTKLEGEIAGPLASLRLIQTYGYSSEQCDQVLEAAYRFPLPGDAAVTQVRVRFGEVEIVTELKPRQQAEAEYEEAVEAGKQAALLTREAADVFTLRLAGLQPDQTVVVETSYVQLARPQGDAANWVLRVPLTTAPRYVREDELGSRHARGQPLALLRDPGHRFSLDLSLQDVGEISSPTHQIEVRAQGEGRSALQLSERSVIPDRDFVLTWAPRQQRDRASLSVFAYDDPGSEYLYFLALVAPPSAHEPGSGLPREVILLVDHSGSMTGPKWEASDWAVNSFLVGLNERDQFDLGLFHTTTKWFSPQPRPAMPEKLEQAARYLDENRDSGGTNLGVALEQALHLKRLDRQERGRHVLIITDAQVTDADRIFRLADQEARRERRRRISVLCIDAAPNAFLANELAERGGGVARFLTSNPEEEDITTALEDVLADWAEPVRVGLKLEIDRGGAEVTERQVVHANRERTAIDLGDLPSGRAIWIVGRVSTEEVNGTIRFDLVDGSSQIVRHSVDVREQEASHAALKALFGARRLLGLEYLIHSGMQRDELRDQLQRMGYDPQEALEDLESSVYAENAREATGKALQGLLVRESLTYGLASSETAFIAVRSEAGKQVEASVVVASALPQGWSDAFLSMPAGGPPMKFAAAPPSTADMGLRGASFQAAAPVASMGNVMFRAREARESASSKPYVVFSGKPSFAEGQAILFDSTGGGLPDQATVSRIEVRFPGGRPKPREIDRDLALLIYVGDMSLPRARVRLADVVRLGGARPLNLRKSSGDRVRIVLIDPNGAWSGAPPEIAITLAT